MPAVDRTFVTEAEFLALPPSAERVELFDGEVVVSPSVTPRHQKVLWRLARALDDVARGCGGEVLVAPLDVRLGRDRILQPDLFWLDRVLPEDAARPLDVVPRLVAEVLSPATEAYDRFGKRLAYAEAGVPTYLVVDADREVVEVFRGPGLRERAVHRDQLSLPELGGLIIDLDVVFARPR